MCNARRTMEKIKMTVKEFLEKFNYAPYDDEELAEIASEVEGSIGEKADVFLNAKREFERALESIGYERG